MREARLALIYWVSICLLFAPVVAPARLAALAEPGWFKAFMAYGIYGAMMMIALWLGCLSVCQTAKRKRYASAVMSMSRSRLVRVCSLTASEVDTEVPAHDPFLVMGGGCVLVVFMVFMSGLWEGIPQVFQGSFFEALYAFLARG